MVTCRNRLQTKMIFGHRYGNWFLTTARVTILNFWTRSGRELGENFLRTFSNFDEELFILGIWECS